MSALLHIETERVVFTLSRAHGGERTDQAPSGSATARARRAGCKLETSWEIPRGPSLWEQTDYVLYARGKSGLSVAITHRDPVLLRDVIDEEGGTVAHGVINFGSHAGYSDFTVSAGGTPEFDLRVEVFASKLAYQSDYESLRDAVQNTLAGLALEYLRPTHEPARAAATARTTGVEWATILRQSCDELDRALREIARSPTRSLSREPALARAEAVKRADASVRASVRKRVGAGAVVRLDEALSLRERLPERRARATLDTPEHRWLAAQVRAARRDATRLREREAQRDKGPRREKSLEELAVLESRLGAMLSLEPLAAATDAPPPGFSSQRLQTAPGYREAYRACLLLGLGLRADGGPMNASLKDLGALYEYFCYLETLGILARACNLAVPLESLFTVREHGLAVNLERGRETRVRFDLSPGRAVTVAYNPRLKSALLPAEQQPDILVRLEQEGWEPAIVLLDAKYRLDASAGYRERFGTAGPPVDALNALHRYRDAILERTTVPSSSYAGRPARSVVAAVALYPERPSAEYEASTLAAMVDAVGVGALPVLPGHSGALERWLRAMVARGAWTLADLAIPQLAVERAREWSRAASESVLLASTGEKGVRAVFQRCERDGGMLVALDEDGGGRALEARWVALFVPRSFGVTHLARVARVTVVSREQLSDEVRAGSNARVFARLQLEPWMSLPQPLKPEGAHSKRAGWPLWTSRLALDRARTIEELLMASEAEWRLFESLVAMNVSFGLSIAEPSEFPGRVWIMGRDAAVRHAGSARFVALGRPDELLSIEQALAAFAARE